MQSSDEEKFEKTMHSSVNCFHKKNDLSFEEEKKCYRKRSSSMSLNLPKNFVPKLKPVKTIICPSPINLNQKSPPKIQEIKNNNNLLYISSSNPQEDLNVKPIKYIYSRKRNLRKSSKILNIEEETHETEAKSDCEDKPRKIIVDSDSESSKSDSEKVEKNNKIDLLKNINILRERMIIIRQNSFCNDNIYDDSSISNNKYAQKRLYPYKNIYQQKFIDKFKKSKNMNLNPLKSIKYRTKSFNIKKRYVTTILGFLEKNNSTNSLNSNGK